MSELRMVKIGDFLFEREGRYKPDDKIVSDLKRLEKIDFQGVFHIGDKSSNTGMILVKPGDFVISGINVTKGAMGIYSGEEDVAATIHYSSYTFDEEIINVGYFKRFLKSKVFVDLLKEQVKGGIKTEIKPKHILSLKIFLPDRAVQDEIVKYFENIEGDISDLVTEITRQQTFLKKLRQSILQDAISGKLTEQWRKENPDVEPASELLKRIYAEKGRLEKEKKIPKQKQLSPISEDEIPFKLPKGWVWSRIDVLLNYNKRGMITGPFGSSLKKEEHASSGVPVWGIESIKHSKFTYFNKIFVTETKAKELQSFSACSGDIIISRSGTIDEICVIPDDSGEGLISTNLLRLSLNKAIIDPEFFCYLFKGCEIILRMLQDLCSGSTRLFLNQKILNSLIFPLPPLPEINEIISKVEFFFQNCDQLESQITKSRQDSEMLMQAVLKEAFEG